MLRPRWPPRRFWLGCLAAAAAVAALAPGAPGAPAAPSVPTPESVLGFVPGEDRKLASWRQVLAYLTALDAASERVSVEEVGKTTEGRPFVIATVTSEANHARLEEIRLGNARLADPRGLDDREAERLVAGGKTIVAMAYSIHSTEVGGTLASLRLLHRLAASDEPRVRAMLAETVLLVIPSHNPDGTDLVSEWYAKQLGTRYEGTAPPRLYHPYAGHDNNRDWYMFALQETRLTVRHVYQRWHPQIVHDVHQMGARGARLFVPPYTDPWEPNVDPALTAASSALGWHVASRLTSAGRTGIVTRALYDAWTPARAYPHTHGGVRILSETASARIATPLQLKPEELEGRGSEYDPRTASANFPAPWPGGAWRLGDIVDTQLQASLAILEHAAQNREHWLRTSLAVNRRAAARREPYAFVVPQRQRDPSALRRLVDVLRTGEVEIERARAPFTAGGTSHPAGTLVVRMQQPASGFAKTLLERQRYPNLREYAGGPPKPPYDVTAHTLPLLLGVDAQAVAVPFDAALEPLGDRPLEPGRIEGRGPRLALAHASGELVALGRLLTAGVEARWTLEPFAEGGRSFPAGTLVVKGSARGRLEPLAAELGFTVRAVRAEPRSLKLRTPRVGLYRSWVSSMDEGWTRYVFEKEMAVPYQTLLDTDVRAGRLGERFDAIVLPDQSVAGLRDGHAKGAMPDEYTGGLGADGGRALKAFVEAGGTLVALDSATAYAIEALGLTVKDALTGVPVKEFYCPGSILGASVDTKRPLAHGLPETLPVWFEGSPAFEADPASVLARYESGDPLLSGWLLGGDRLRDKAALVEAPLGRGRVVLFGFRPQYRAQSRVSYVALLNALYLSAARP
jgi:Zinc carboxypeptidase